MTELVPGLLEGVGVGEGFGEKVEVGLGMGDGVELEIGDGVGLELGEEDGVGLSLGEAALLINTPLSQKSVLPLLMQVNFLPPKFFFNPILEQLAPGLGGEATLGGVIEMKSERATRRARSFIDRMINVIELEGNQ